MFNAQNIPDVKLELMIELQQIDLCVIVEGDLMPMLLFLILYSEHLVSFLFCGSPYLLELIDDSLEFIQDRESF